MTTHYTIDIPDNIWRRRRRYKLWLGGICAALALIVLGWLPALIVAALIQAR